VATLLFNSTTTQILRTDGILHRVFVFYQSRMELSEQVELQTKIKAPKFCQNCGQPVSPVTATKYVCPDGHKTYLNPVPVGVAVLAVEGGGYLLGRRNIPPGKGKLAFISGNIEADEDIFEGLSREVEEEYGLLTHPQDWKPLHFCSATGNGKVLLFAQYKYAISPGFIAHVLDGEMSEFVVVDEVHEDMAFPLHEAVLRQVLN